MGHHQPRGTSERRKQYCVRKFQLEKGLAKMEAAWETLAFVTKEWRTSYILVSTDEIQQELDDQIVKTQAMRGSSASQRPKHLARPPKATV